MTKKISIAIDGPAGAGKSTVAKIVADRLSYTYIDTGAMYRAFTYKAIKENINMSSEEELVRMLKETTIELKNGGGKQLVLLDGEDVTKEIRQPDITNSVSEVAAHPFVREEMVARQKALGAEGGVVMDGRDIGTNVLPHSELKIFLSASADIRATRRHKENIEKGYPSDLAKIKSNIMVRDKQDTERKVSPLRKAEDAIEIDTSFLSVDEVVSRIIQLAKERIEAS
ncbi:(d)CMP kinase [Siminovitchia sp. 179-K 8D1 HS]|uniref:(d)CMP kinase n=1 Tax=Siminovitchia sp. 179-K 8D1 HS TaxID=3142385 RepID=UPI0039A31297